MTITAPDRAQGRHLATRSGRIPAISPPHRHELHRQQLIPPLGAPVQVGSARHVGTPEGLVRPGTHPQLRSEPGDLHVDA
jgi:hypothetical protein